MKCFLLEWILSDQIITLDEKLDSVMFANVAKIMQIHVYTYNKHGKYHICSCGVANVAFTMFAIGVTMFFIHICHTGKHDQIRSFDRQRSHA